MVLRYFKKAGITGMPGKHSVIYLPFMNLVKIP